MPTRWPDDLTCSDGLFGAVCTGWLGACLIMIGEDGGFPARATSEVTGLVLIAEMIHPSGFEDLPD
ncbi:hypothetical protein DL93DRAFT_2073111 [Clavulina sp. PMI_390]|nr:hypothetical protein DL93DRAFT_2073111 [Clavulina sp. PMI_390]